MPSLRDLYTGQYANGGRGEKCPRTGVPLFDCWGLVMAGHEALGAAVPDFAHDSEDVLTVADEYGRQRDTGVWERLDAPVAPCVVAMRTHPRAPQAVNHFGVFIGGGKFLHILRGCRVHVSGVDQHPYRQQIAGYWRWRG